MTSTISFNKLIKENMRHYGWLLVLSSFVELFVGPILLLLVISSSRVNYLANQEKKAQITTQIYNFVSDIYPPMLVSIAIVGSIIVAIYGFRHLFSRRISDLYESAPISRNKRFAICYVSGFLTWMIPFMVFWLITAVIASTVGTAGPSAALIFPAMLRSLGLGFLSFFIAFHLCLLAVMYCGSVLSSLLYIALLGSDILIFYGLLYIICQSSLKSFVELPIRVGTVALFAPLCSPYFITFHNTLIPGWSLAGYIACNLIISVFILMAALWKYNKRAAELAENGTDHSAVSVGLRFFNAFLAGLVGMVAISTITPTQMIGWIFVGSLIGVVATYIVASLIQKKGYKPSKKDIIGILLTYVVSVSFFLVINNDLFGYDSYVPRQENIKSVSFLANQYNEKEVFLDESGSLRSYNYYTFLTDYETFSYDITDPAVMYRLLEAGATGTVNQDADNLRYALTFNVHVTRTNGTSYYRQYAVDYSKISEVLALIVEKEDYLEKNYPLSMGLIRTPNSVALYPADPALSDRLFSLDDNQIKEFMAAYTEDFKQHANIDLLNSKVSCIRANLCFYTDSNTLYSNLEIPAEFTKTISLIKSWYPEIHFNFEELKYDSVNWRTEQISTGDLSTALGSIFGLEGYPDRNQYLYDNDEQQVIFVSAVLPDNYDVSRIAPYLLFGNYDSNYATPSRYVEVGQLVCSRNSSCLLYVDIQNIPLDIVNDFEIVQDLDYNKYEAVDDIFY